MFEKRHGFKFRVLIVVFAVLFRVWYGCSHCLKMRYLLETKASRTDVSPHRLINEGGN